MRVVFEEIGGEEVRSEVYQEGRGQSFRSSTVLVQRPSTISTLTSSRHSYLDSSSLKHSLVDAGEEKQVSSRTGRREKSSSGAGLREIEREEVADLELR